MLKSRRIEAGACLKNQQATKKHTRHKCLARFFCSLCLFEVMFCCASFSLYSGLKSFGQPLLWHIFIRLQSPISHKSAETPTITDAAWSLLNPNAIAFGPTKLGRG